MSFLDNSGDIILDAVLTDTGRFRLAKGDGSFRVVKFALGDDEINYSSYDSTNASGSAYYDLSILQTPILEAFTDNSTSLKSKLISISRTNLLYLPVIKLNDKFESSTALHSSGAFFVAVDKDTEKSLSTKNGSTVAGVILGESKSGGSYIRVDQGLDTAQISPSFTIDADLIETQYIVEIDNRFGKIVDKTNSSVARVSYVDDDNVASYYFSLGTDTGYVLENSVTESNSPQQVIAGPRGTYFQFTIGSSIELNTSDYLFEQLGDYATINGSTYRYIDSTVRITGATTGYKVDVPVRFMKQI